MATVKKAPATKIKKTPVKKVAEVKKVVEKKPAKAAVVKQVKKVVEKPAKRVVDGLTAHVMGVDGKETSTLTLSKEVFGEKPNTQLMSQAVRVYLANQRQGGANTKTRGEVEGSTRKIYKQKGTGRARHGSIRAHIFVGGGVAFGPVTHDFSLSMPTKMKRKALISALSKQYSDGNITFVDGLEKMEAKTKAMAAALVALNVTGSTLVVLAKDSGEVARISRNIQSVDMLPVSNISTYDIISHSHIVFMKHAVQTITELVTK